jgi:hypothetical protein
LELKHWHFSYVILFSPHPDLQPGLNSALALHTQLRKTPSDCLLQRHVEIAAKIKILDSDMQMLVYENYNKFISAIDAIRR